MDYIALMSAPSKWPLPDAGIRFLTPAFMVEKLARHPLTKDCYPTAIGYYPDADRHALSEDKIGYRYSVRRYFLQFASVDGGFCGVTVDRQELRLRTVSSGAALSETGVFSDRSGHNGDVAVRPLSFAICSCKALFRTFS